MSERDTQFIGFAKLLLKELLDDVLAEYGFIGGDRNAYADLNYDLAICEEIIAHRAYDLVEHAVTHADPKDLDVLGFDEAIGRIPDMVEWSYGGETKSMYLIENGEYCGAQSLEILKPPRED
jgi:hypothetical protein